ncbi:MAG TPA: hypothetical protein VJ914_18230 [Pseudonocardiaceae bacterium]|nr:hypothetical protein [Pseudonocardiaceae bacterium]
MSVLGEVARISPDELDRLRLDGGAYDYLDGLRFVMDAAGFPVNPIGGGRPYPDERSAWGHGMPNTTSCALTADEVRQVAARASYDWSSHAVQMNAARYYGMLDAIFQEAATYGECTVFWAA